MKKNRKNIRLRNNITLQVEQRQVASRVEVLLSLQSKKKCLLHWGICGRLKGPWQIPPRSIRPADTCVFGPNAVQTPFKARNDINQIIITLDQNLSLPVIAFVLFFPAENYWDNNNGKNYSIKLLKSVEALLLPNQALAEITEKKEIAYQQVYHLDEERQLAAAACKDGDRYTIFLISDIPGKLVLHWGVAKQTRYEWRLPPDSLRSVNTVLYDDSAAQTPFVWENGLNRLELEFNGQDAPLGIPFVLKQTDTEKWYKKHRGNFYIPVNASLYEETVLETPSLTDVAQDIIEKETGRNSWTLMHRFDLCHDLLDRAGNDVEGLALLFVWLRFSAIRQLDWQRNYNTKPRELAHAQKRLTLKLAAMYNDNKPASREIIRLILSTLGRGGEGGKGQRIRDDILHIMHRHKIKEVSGHFMEEWHQKLHNNATPDDIVICEAYLEFLRSNGDLALFYKTLENNGVTRERLETFERPIKTAPDFVPHIKDGLIHDFENYLKLLKSIHSATDLESTVKESGHCLDEQLTGQIAYILHTRDDADMEVVDRVRLISDARRAIHNLLHNDMGEECVRKIVYLDLALEEFLRVAVERELHKTLKTSQLVELIGMMVENVRFSHDEKELAYCADHWERLKEIKNIDKEWALHARSVLDRITRILSAYGDYYYRLLQAKAQHLGNAFHADSWTIDLFSQEIVRAGSAFVLSILLHHIDPLLRKIAHLGSWQVISQADTEGRVEIDTLLRIQDKKFDYPTVIITDRVTGDEEIPEGVVAVITADGVDILSHVSVRARNAHTLFATCYDAKIIDELKSRKDKIIQIKVNASGDVEFEEAEGKTKNSKRQDKKEAFQLGQCRPVNFKSYALSAKDFTDEMVGGKSYQLHRLQGKLPDWIHLPLSTAIPFGVCEKVLEDKYNKEIKKQYDRLAEKVDYNPGEILPQLRKTLMALYAPTELILSLCKVMEDEGLGRPTDWDTLWVKIKHVWASKWNERAYWSRKKWRVTHSELYMAVLIQQVVAAEYAFVIHTADPFTGAREELYAEMVAGLGETLCSGNYPGRAFGFSCRKGKNLQPQLVSYPSKHVALKGGGLIVRSDSNGEDLEEYAGAGLYDSVLLEPPHEELLDYTSSPLLWNTGFRKIFCKKITRIGIEIENILDGCPQDIEGAYANGTYYVVQTRPQAGVKCR